MKRSKVKVLPSDDLENWELVYSFNDKPIAVVPLGSDDETIKAAMYLESAFNNAQPED